MSHIRPHFCPLTGASFWYRVGPLVDSLLGPTGLMKGLAVDEGLGSAAPGQPAPFACVGHMTFETVEAFQQAFGPNAPTIMGDIPNFTNVQPVVQISRIV